MADEEVQEGLEEFALGYTPADRDEFRFQWNGQDSEEFEDENEEIRTMLAEWILQKPDQAPLELIVDVLREDVLWAQQAWKRPEHMSALFELLASKGGSAYLDEFAEFLERR